ncbi:MAG: acyl-CoA dehydrogenase family protein [Actinomycetota bacterium]
MTAGVAAADPLDPGLDPGFEPAIDAVVDQLLAKAEATDQADHLPQEHFAALADLGLYGMVVAPEAGGLGLAPPTIRRVLRRLGSGCGATAFAFAQHHGTTASVASTANAGLRDRWLGPLTSRALAGIAYAHVRRSGTPVLRATPESPSAGSTDGETWVLDGEAPWVTSWGLAEVLGVAARTDDGRMVWALVPAKEAPGLSVAKRFELSVLGATATVALHFDDYRVQPDQLLSVVDFAPWAGHDRHLAARPNPLCLGVGDRAMAMLADVAPERAAELGPAWADIGRRSEEQAVLVDQRRADEDTVAGVRAEAVLATQHLTSALLAAVGGRAMVAGHPAQRLHREAGFYVVQAQNESGQRAMLDRVARRLI